MKVAIVDDRESDLLLLQKILERFFDFMGIEAKIHNYESGEAFLSSVNKQPYDLVFLDIFMPGLNGMETARKLIEINSECTIIFLTTSRDFALEGYEVGAFRYLLKPLTYERCEETLTPFLKKFKHGIRRLSLMIDRIPLRISYSDIYYASSVMRTTEIHLKNEVLKQSSAVNFSKTIEPLLSDSRFYSPSKGILVNLEHVSQIENGIFFLDNKETVPISRRKMTEAKRSFLNFNLNRVPGKE